jgi:hypothetical protein
MSRNLSSVIAGYILEATENPRRSREARMSGEAYRYTFSDDASASTAKDLLLLSVVAVECLRGGSVVRLDAACQFDESHRTCVVECGTDVGQSIARIFTGFLTREFGEQAFRVERIGGNTTTDTKQSTEGGPS